MNNPSEYIESDTFYKVVHQVVRTDDITYDIRLNTLPMDFSGMMKIYLRSYHFAGIGSGGESLVRIELNNVPQPFSQTNVYGIPDNSIAPNPNQVLCVAYIGKDTNGDYGVNGLMSESIICNISPNSIISFNLRSIDDTQFVDYDNAHFVLDFVPLRRRENRGDSMLNLALGR
jgi:hypothetical protein